MQLILMTSMYVCCFFFLDVQLPEAGFSRDGNFLSFFFFLFVSQSSYFKKVVEIKKRKGETDRNRERGRERKKKIDTFPELSCFRKSGMNEW